MKLIIMPCQNATLVFEEKSFISWSRKLRVTSPDKQASMYEPRFGTIFKQSSK